MTYVDTVTKTKNCIINRLQEGTSLVYLKARIGCRVCISEICTDQ